ncbi:Dps family protein [Aureimonas jatrophae]|uniref:Starvation-inducible DNA-binding protein n=1 Tax=Aureimonas jatrophae TaxID=1166073 RepID=A0A1H0MLC5_9HYPH|nr:DNA starvation/stationary phase protection protein [Aureimonas jatrophae]MBB3952899.1 starvation-inducible DNA-binding protein [Aureimonas jatrophae]SDO81263.1 starvation-inducible DNA-binding protein [Aureimonas jatrophae]
MRTTLLTASLLLACLSGAAYPALAQTPPPPAPPKPSPNQSAPANQSSSPSQASSGDSASSGKEAIEAATSSQGRDLAPALRRVGADGSSSPDASLALPQDQAPFPNNQVSSAPYISPNGGEEGLKASVRSLQNTLTELQTLQLQTKQAHWNVSGPFFYPLHEQLQEQYETWSKLADTVAERLLAIGVSSDGRATTIVQTSSLPEFPGGFVDDAEVVRWFTLAYKQVGEEVRGGILASEENDPETSNILQEVEGSLGKYQWMMRSYVQSTPTDQRNGEILNQGKAIDIPANTAPTQLNIPTAQ